MAQQLAESMAECAGASLWRRTERRCCHVLILACTGTPLHAQNGAEATATRLLEEASRVRRASASAVCYFPAFVIIVSRGLPSQVTLASVAKTLPRTESGRVA